MIFSIDPAVRQTFPDIQVGVATIGGVSVLRASPEVDQMVSEVLDEIRASLGSTSLGSLPKVQAFRLDRQQIQPALYTAFLGSSGIGNLLSQHLIPTADAQDPTASLQNLK